MRAADSGSRSSSAPANLQGNVALPGGRLQANRSLEESAFATLASTTDLHPTYLEQLYTFGDPMRSSNGIPMVSVCYWALLDHADLGHRAWHGGQCAQRALVPGGRSARTGLRPHHNRGVCAVRLRHRMDAPNVVRQLIAEPFTLGQLHDVVEAVLGEEIDLANFRRKMLASHNVGRHRRGGTGGPQTACRAVSLRRPCRGGGLRLLRRACSREPAWCLRSFAGEYA